MTRTRIRAAFGAAGAAVLLFTAACGEDSEKSESTEPATDAAGGGGGATFEFVPLDVGGPNTKAALEKGDIDIALLFSSDGAISKNEWVALVDDKRLQPVDNFVPAIRKEKVTVTGVEALLNNISAAMTREKVQEMVAKVAIDGENPEDVAKEFIESVDFPDGPVTGSFNVGGSNFAESEIAAQIYGQALMKAGATVSFSLNFGSRETYLAALESGQLDIVPEFVGTLDTFLGGTASNDLDETLADAKTKAEAKGFTLTKPAPADSVNTFVVTQETADKYSLEKVSDLANVSDPLTLGGPPECPTRPFCLLGLQETYGLKFRS